MDPAVDVVCFASKEWDSHRQRPHWVVEEIARRRGRVLFVENLGTRLPHRGELRRATSKLGRWAWTSVTAPTRERAPGVRVDAPLSPPFQQWRSARRVSAALLGRRIRQRSWPRDGRRALVVMTYLPMPVIRDVAVALGADLLVYEWADEASTHMVGASAAHRRRVARWENEMLDAADLVFVASAELLRRRYGDHPSAVALPHGREPARTASATRAGATSPARPTIGFVGSITEHTDLDLVGALARARPEWSFVMVGPSRIPLGAMRSMSNIAFTGGVDYDSVHDHLASFDAAIVPYRITPTIEVASPLKVQDYLAYGLPVVSVDIAEVRGLAPHVEVARTTEEFLLALDRAVERGRSPAPPAPTWSDRVDEMLEHLTAALARRDVPTHAPTAAAPHRR